MCNNQRAYTQKKGGDTIMKETLETKIRLSQALYGHILSAIEKDDMTLINGKTPHEFYQQNKARLNQRDAFLDFMSYMNYNAEEARRAKLIEIAERMGWVNAVENLLPPDDPKVKEFIEKVNAEEKNTLEKDMKDYSGKVVSHPLVEYLRSKELTQEPYCLASFQESILQYHEDYSLDLQFLLRAARDLKWYPMLVRAMSREHAFGQIEGTQIGPEKKIIKRIETTMEEADPENIDIGYLLNWDKMLAKSTKKADAIFISKIIMIAQECDNIEMLGFIACHTQWQELLEGILEVYAVDQNQLSSRLIEEIKQVATKHEFANVQLLLRKFNKEIEGEDFQGIYDMALLSGDYFTAVTMLRANSSANPSFKIDAINSVDNAHLNLTKELTKIFNKDTVSTLDFRTIHQVHIIPLIKNRNPILAHPQFITNTLLLAQENNSLQKLFQLALYSGWNEMVNAITSQNNRFMIDANNPIVTSQARNPISFAVARLFKGNDSMLRALVQADVDLSQPGHQYFAEKPDFPETSGIILISQYYLQRYSLDKLLEKIHEETDPKFKNLLKKVLCNYLNKRYANVMDLKAYYDLASFEENELAMHTNNDQTVELEGGTNELGSEMLNLYLTKFIESRHIKIPGNKKLLQHAFQGIQKGTDKKLKITDITSAIDNNEYIAMPLGLPHHAVSMVICGDFVFRINRGAYSEEGKPGIHVYRIKDKNALKKAITDRKAQFADRKDFSISDYSDTFLRDAQLDPVHYIKMTPQTSGNCFFVSQKAMVLAAMMGLMIRYEGTKTKITDEKFKLEVDKIFARVGELYERFSGFARVEEDKFYHEKMQELQNYTGIDSRDKAMINDAEKKYPHLNPSVGVHEVPESMLQSVAGLEQLKLPLDLHFAREGVKREIPKPGPEKPKIPTKKPVSRGRARTPAANTVARKKTTQTKSQAPKNVSELVHILANYHDFVTNPKLGLNDLKGSARTNNAEFALCCLAKGVNLTSGWAYLDKILEKKTQSGASKKYYDTLRPFLDYIEKGGNIKVLQEQVKDEIKARSQQKKKGYRRS